MSNIFTLAYKEFQEWNINRKMAKQAKELKNFMKNDWVIVANYQASINYTDTGSSSYFSYILKENGVGDRKCEGFTNDNYRKFKDHRFYVNVIIPWLHGYNYSNIPSYAEIKSNIKPIDTNK